jgi:hypothetical protein
MYPNLEELTQEEEAGALKPIKFPRRLQENLGLLHLIDELDELNEESIGSSNIEERISETREDNNDSPGFFRAFINIDSPCSTSYLVAQYLATPTFCEPMLSSTSIRRIKSKKWVHHRFDQSMSSMNIDLTA